MADLAKTNPDHPYVILGVDQVTAAMASFMTLVEKRGLPYAGATATDSAKVGDNLHLPSPVGAARPTFLAPMGQIAGDLARPEPMLIVGFEGLRDFYPALIAENLNKQGIQTRAVLLPYDLLTDRRDANTIQLAHELDDPDRRARVAEALRGLVQSGERIGLPAILGMDAHAALMAELAKCAECADLRNSDAAAQRARRAPLQSAARRIGSNGRATSRRAWR